MITFFLCVADSVVREATMRAEEGGVAPNPEVLRLSDGSRCHLLDAAVSARPLVINFGSCS